MQHYATRSDYLAALAARRLTKNCVQCGWAFDVAPCLAARQRFCGKACFLRWQADPARFWERVDRSGACWLWIGRGRHRFGYGKCTFQGKDWNAHCLAWFLTNGPIPNGLCVLHQCDNPPCCNPAHLFLGTKGDNSRDMFSKGRNAPQAGERNPSARLTTNQVRAIRRRLPKRVAAKFPYGTLRALAREFGVSEATINMIASGKHWKGVA